MESRAKLLGHPIHPVLIPFPLGLLTTSVVFDVDYLLTDDGKWSGISFWMIAAGVIGGLAAAVFGLIDWLAIPSGTRAKSVGLWHGSVNVMVVALFTVSWLLRLDAPGEPGIAPIVLSFVGEGVAEGAHLNAPSSLSGCPASEESRRTQRGERGMSSSR
jgi:uncharacterized membrane protein